MSTIDERIVRMGFDNKQFESGVSETMSSLQKLKMALDLRGGDKGMQDVQKAANGLDFSAINDRIYQVQQNFSFFGEFVRNVFDRISNKIIDLGSTMVQELTVRPLTAGFGEYELQMDSTQTIMASTGKSIEEVSGYLDELNTYADKTIYSFSDMTANIGKFTNAGVELDDAVAAIQGISNEAAVSGANANEASRAMYNFSQALSSGAVKLIDWKSIENANMATVEFKQQLLDTAVALGTVTKDGDTYVSTTTDLQGKVSDAFNVTKGFNDSLSAQWMTTEVLTETLKHYATDVRSMSDTEKDAYEERLKNLGYTDEQIKNIEELGKKAFDSAQDVKTFSQLVDTVKESLGSGWTKSFQYMIGNLEEAKVLWTGVNKEITAILDPIAEAREEMLKFWHDNGGRDKAIEAISNAWTGLKSIMETASKAFQNVFPPMTGKTLLGITDRIHALSVRFKEFALSKRTISNLSYIFGGLASTLKLFARAAQSVYERLRPLLDILGEFGGTLFDSFAYFGKFAMALTEAEDPLAAIGDASVHLNKGMRTIAEGLDSLISSLLHFIGIDIKSNPLTTLYDTVSGFVKAGFDSFDLGIFSGIGTAVSGAFSSLLGGISDGTAGAEGAGEVETVGDKLSSAFNGVSETLGDIVSKIIPNSENGIGSFADFLGGVGETIAGFVTGINEKIPEIFAYFSSPEFKNFTEAIRTLTGGGLLIALTEFVNSFTQRNRAKIDQKGFFGTLKDTISGFVKDVSKRAEGAFESLGGAIEKFQQGVRSGQLLLIAVSLTLLAHSIKTLAAIDAERAADGVATLTVTMLMLLGGLKIMQTILTATGGIGKIGSELIKMAIALAILSNSVKMLSGINIKQLGNGLAVIAWMLLEYATVVKMLDGVKVNSGAIGAIISVTFAIKVLEGTVKSFAAMNWSTIAVGLASVGAMMFELYAFTTMLDGTSVSLSAIVSLVAVTAAIKILEGTVKSFAAMNWRTIAVGLSAVGVMLIELFAFLALVDGVSVSVSAIATIIAVTAAVKLLEETVITFSRIGWPKLSEGLMGIGVILGVIVLALAALGAGSPMMLVGAASLLIVTAALKMFVPAIESLAKIKQEDIQKAIGGITLALIGLGVGLAVLGLVSPLAIAASAAFALLGLAAGVLGTGLTTLAAGATAFAGAMTANATAFTTSVSIIANGIVTLIGSIITGFATGLVKGIAGFFNGIAEILAAVGNAIHAIGDFIIGNLPYILSVVSTCIISLLALATTYIPQLAYIVVQFVVAVINTIVSLLPVLAETLVQAVIVLLNSIANGIRNNAEAILSAVGNILSSIIELVLLAIENILRLIPGVGDMLADKVAAGKDIVQKTLAPDSFETSAKDAIGGATKGIELGASGMADAAATAGDETKSSIEESLSGGADISGSFMDELMSGFTGANGDLSGAGEMNLDSYIDAFNNTGAADSAGSSISSELLASLETNSGGFNSAGAVDVNEFIRAFTSTNANQAGASLANTAASGASSSSGKFTSAGNTDSNAFKNAISRASASSAGKSLGNSGAAGAGSTGGSYRSTGADVAYGFSWSGVASGTALSYARSAGSRLGSAALAGIKAAVRSGSPSREAMKIGRWTTEGFAIGIRSMSNLAYEESVGVGQRSLRGIKDSIQAISKYVDSDMELDPTIRPVMDLSNIQNGVAAANSMVGTLDRSVSVGMSEIGTSARSPMYGFAKALADQNARNLSNMMQTYSNSDIGRIPPKVEVNVYGVSGPEEVADAVTRKVKLLGLV